MVSGHAPPLSESELLARADAIAGSSVAEVAKTLALPVPPDLSRHKGWLGQLVERALGASAGSRSEPDFQALGIELKTVPIDTSGRPYESTFVCMISATELSSVEFEASRVRHKLARVLWVPVDGDRKRRLAERRFGTPFLWSPDAQDWSALRCDWEELAGLAARVGMDAISAHMGQFLQIRPKARDSRARSRAFDIDGARCEALPRGFYLRAGFTGSVLRRYFGLAD